MHIHTLHCVNEEFIGSTIYCGLFVTFEHCHLAIVSNLLHHSLFCYYPLKTNPQKTIFNWFWCVSSHYHAAMYGFCFLQRSPFSTPASSMLKILSMTAGDFSFDTVFRLSPSGESEDHDEILFPVISYFLWIILLIIMPLLFINMLVRSRVYWQALKWPMVDHIKCTAHFTSHNVVFVCTAGTHKWARKIC